MWRKSLLVLAVLGLAIGGNAASLAAADPSHSNERCQLHGGQVTETKQHHFETVFVPQGVYLYVYTEKQEPALFEGVKGAATVKMKDGTSRALALSVDPLKKGEKAVYFCTMEPEVMQGEPGECPKCGMKLVPQDRLFGKMDLSSVEPGSMKVEFKVTRLPGKEKEVTFAETFQGLSAPPAAGKPH